MKFHEILKNYLKLNEILKKKKGILQETPFFHERAST